MGRRVVSLAGVVDLRLAADLGLGTGAVDAFMGATPSEAPEAYAAADPAVLTPAVPVVLLHGGTIVPLGISESYLRRQVAHGHPEVASGRSRPADTSASSIPSTRGSTRSWPRCRSSTPRLFAMTAAASMPACGCTS